MPGIGGLADAVTVLGVHHVQGNTAAIMFGYCGLPTVNWISFPLSPHWYKASFLVPWRVLIFCEPLSIAIAYEERRGGMYGCPYERGKDRDPFDVFCESWLALWDWFKDAGDRGVYPDKMNIICMDRTHQPKRERHDWVFGQELEDLYTLVAARDADGLLNDDRIAPYVHWMREHREIFEFVDQVGSYESGWWLDD